MSSFLIKISKLLERLSSKFFVCWWVFVFFNAFSSSYAAEFSLYSRAGLFQQPSSQYYHFTQGLGLRFLVFEDMLGMEATYDQRPKFKSEGYEDQEEFTTINFGGSFKKFKHFRLASFVGVSRIYGYIRSTNPDMISEKREYEMHAASLSMQIEVVLKNIITSFGVQNFHGFSTREQSEIYVAWPFYGFVLGLGASI